MKGYKVSNAKRTKMCGIACRSLKELTEKARKKFEVPKSVNVEVYLSDGTMVDTEEYFASLPAQTVLILKQDDEEILTGADIIYSALKAVNIDILRAADVVQKFFDENIKEKVRVLSEVLIKRKGEDKSKLSQRSEDPAWFSGLETNAQTKEEFMFRRSQERIRGYLYKTQNDIKKSKTYLEKATCRSVLDNVFNEFKEMLTKDKYFGCYFDRSIGDSLCDNEGLFNCSGIWKYNGCSYSSTDRHVINPYTNREARIIFSTWNLDHGIERSRSIVPALIKAAELCCNKASVNVAYFYSLLFTINNLRLVHIVCHDKGKHKTAQCDPKKIIISS